MKKFLVSLAIVLGLLFAIVANALWWMMNPEAPLNFSNPLWKWAKRMYGVTTAYQESDLAFLMSSAAIALGFIAIMLVYRHWRKRRGSRRRHS
jgi:O-antigen/teichoic acid export membrane protein